MSINYQEALHQLLQYDVARTAYFDVTIPSPSGLIGTSLLNVDTKKMTYLCHSAELPGESSATVSQKIYGVVEKHAIMSAYNDITLSFYTIGSNVEEVRKTFLTWIALITGRGDVINGNPTTYNVRYKDEYVSQPVITHYTSAGQKLLDCTLIDAYPISIAQVPLAWSAENHAISFNVTFAYTEYKYNFYNQETLNPINQQIYKNTLQNLTDFNTFSTFPQQLA